jgi:hypothetical protein
MIDRTRILESQRPCHAHSLQVPNAASTPFCFSAGTDPRDDPRDEEIDTTRLDSTSSKNARNLLLGLRPLREPVARPEGGEKGVESGELNSG